MQPSAFHLLLIGDDTPAKRDLDGFLKGEGYRTALAQDRREAKALLAAGDEVDLVLLDIASCRNQGFSLIGELHSLANARLILIADQGDQMGCVCGLEMGADDCVYRPFHWRELRARIRNQVATTRALRQGGDKGEPKHQYLRFSGWTLSVERRTLTAPNGDLIKLTNGEFVLLAALAANPGQVISRDWLLDHISARGLSPTSRSVDVTVAQLRRKLGDDSKQPSLIITVHGVGYRLNIGQPT